MTANSSRADEMIENTRRQVLVIYNPTAGQHKQRRYRAVMNALGELGVTITEKLTTRRGDAERLASEVVAHQYDAIVIAGGDGTINEAINGLHAGSPPLAIVPLGTANLLAAEIGLELDPTVIAHTIAIGEPGLIRLGLANRRRFVMMAGIGIDSHVIQSTSPGLKRMTGKGAYMWQTLVELGRFPFPTYTVTIENIRHKVGSVVFANGHFYGGRLVLAPEARLEGPALHACLLEGKGRWNFIRYGLALTRNRLATLKDVKMIKFEKAEIDGPVGDPVHADGDIVEALPITVKLDPKPLQVVLPVNRGKH
jgi:diacylglycerol kinase (ATP)